MKTNNNIFLLLGGNLGDIQETFTLTRSQIQSKIGKEVLASKIYKSEPWGFTSPDLFLNQVLQMETTKTCAELLEITQSIELELGRVRKVGTKTFESRNIDIDILYFNSDIVSTPNLQVPHYAMHKRRFTLLPLVEIAPNYIHPIFQVSNSELLNQCLDQSLVTAI